MTAFKNSYVVTDNVKISYSFRSIDNSLFQIDKGASVRRKFDFHVLTVT